MSDNSNLHSAKRKRDDEFYTRYEDIEKEISIYSSYFPGKKVYLNCDDPYSSAFWEYFHINFSKLGLARLTATHVGADSYFEYSGGCDRNVRCMEEKDLNSGKFSSFLTENIGTGQMEISMYPSGDFRSPGSIELMKESDIIVTNPPFSFLKQFLMYLSYYKKDFIIVGNLNCIKYKEIFSMVKEGKIHTGTYYIKNFKRPDGSDIRLGNTLWYTNLDDHYRSSERVRLEMKSTYTPERYRKYDSFDAINVDSVKNIPKDYDGPMGVPISYIVYHDPSLFEIKGELNHGTDSKYDFAKPVIDGNEMFPRLLIKRKKADTVSASELNS